ncbi:bifunctional phosphoribosyl-AMP cyclohydrolase/phosphoribosyl-ATP diphosphatase HisIE [Buchnera aphidicola (Mollitrichosiphum nigrofasciatum)]|uniref:bifunctional phosphoribosyl-AMP cyclohydrolase/phosphoribosyl-ATP diphosphatase HisIE n=1 Tax=Buchnera aphidicola TaxID=9 RepID=UPI0031B84F3B
MLEKFQNNVKIDWIKVNKLIPVIVQNVLNGMVLMHAYMNFKALYKTQKTGFMVFYSRTKKKLWMKGEFSGNFLILVHLIHDCDNDTLLALVKSIGKTCHLDQDSCFKYPNSSFIFLNKLENCIENRKHNMERNSYTKKLYNSGVNRIIQKFGEEAVEVIISVCRDNKKNIINEVSDLIYHLMVVLSAKEIPLSVICNNLYNRS